MRHVSGQPVRMDDVPVLLIGESDGPPPECPRCGRVFIHCALNVSVNGIECSRCRQMFRVWDVPRHPGLVLVGLGRQSGLDIPTRSWRTAWVAVLGFLAPLFAVGHFAESAVRISGVHDNDPVRGLGWALISILAASTLAGFGILAYWFWGRYSIQVDGSEGVIFRGVATLGLRDVFSTAGIKEVRVERVVTGDVEKHLVRIVGGQHPVEFGNSLTSVQRTWIALFLLEHVCAA